MFSRAAVNSIKGAARRAPQMAKNGTSRLLSSVEAAASKEPLATAAEGAASKAASKSAPPPHWKGGWCGKHWQEFAQHEKDFAEGYYRVRRGVTGGKVAAVAVVGGTGYWLGSRSENHRYYNRYPYPYPYPPHQCPAEWPCQGPPPPQAMRMQATQQQWDQTPEKTNNQVAPTYEGQQQSTQQQWDQTPAKTNNQVAPRYEGQQQ